MENPQPPLVNESAPPGITPPAAPPEPVRSSRGTLLIVFLVVFIDLFGFGIVLPLLPRYGKDFLPAGISSGASGAILGLLMASFSAMQFVFAPLWGRVSDRVGRRPILLLGLASSVVFYTLFGVASTLGREGWRELGLTLLFVSRLGAGIAGATISTAQAAIADATTPEGRSRGMALIGAAFGIGFFFGPLLGFGALSLFPEPGPGSQAAALSWHAGTPGFLAAGLSLIAGVLGFLLLPETLRPGSPHARRHWLDVRGVRTALQAPRVGRLILIFFLSTLAFASFEPTLALITGVPAFGLNDRNNFLVFAYVGLVLAVSQGLLYRRLALRVREITFMWIGTVLMALGLGGVGGVAVAASGVPERSSGLLAVLLVILAVAITGFGFVLPSIQSLISRLSDPGKQGEVLGLNQSANAMARILGPFLGVWLFRPNDPTASHVLPYVFGVALLAAALILTARVRLQPGLTGGGGERPVHG